MQKMRNILFLYLKCSYYYKNFKYKLYGINTNTLNYYGIYYHKMIGV